MKLLYISLSFSKGNFSLIAQQAAKEGQGPPKTMYMDWV
jgi:hypothetical protein